MKNKIPEKVIHRLTLYHCILKDYINNGENVISSKQIAYLLNIDDSQVRKDINYLNNSGKSRVGYLITELKKAIESTLGFANSKNAFIIGAGNLGTALAKYDNFTNYGLNIIALFDNDKNKIGKKIDNKVIYDIKDLQKYTKELGVEIAILTVPAIKAQKTVNIISDANIKYIWNFTPTILNVSKDIQVWNENLIGHFLQFTL